MNKFYEPSASKASITRRSLVLGVGVNDASYTTSAMVNGKLTRCPFYLKWHNMLKRCYDGKYQEQFPSYKGCLVCEEWLIFSNFREWMMNQDWDNKELDKDIKISGNKIYSPRTCIFVSQKINSLLLGCDSARGVNPRGVSYHKTARKFAAQCRGGGKKKYLGLFDSAELASAAYRSFKSDLILSIAREQDEPLRGYLVRISSEFKRPKAHDK